MNGKSPHFRVVLVAALFWVSACNEPDVAASTTLSPDAAQIEVRITELSNRVQSSTGTFTDLARAGRLARSASQVDIQACMAKAGFDYPIVGESYKVEELPGYANLGSSWWSKPDLDFARSYGYGTLENALIVQQADLQHQQTVSPPNQYSSLSVDARARYDSALRACSEVAFAAQTGADQFSTRSYELRGKIDDAISHALSVSPGAQVKAHYKECMRSAGFPVDAPEQVFNQILLPIFDAKMAFNQVGATPAFVEAQAFERKVAVADITCRIAIGNDLIPILDREISAWEATNAIALSELKSYLTSTEG